MYPESLSISKAVRTRWINVFKLLLAAILVAVLLLNTSVVQIIQVLRGASPDWLLLSVFLFLLSNLAKAFQYHLLIQDKLPYRSVLNVILIQNVVSNLLATGAGIASFFALYTGEYQVKASRTLGTFLLIKLGDLVQIWLFLSLSAWAVWDLVNPLQPVIVILWTLILTGIAMFFAAIFMRQRFLSVLRLILNAIHLANLKIMVRLLDALESLVALDNQFVLYSLRRALFGAFVYMLTTLAWTYSTAQALHFPVGIMPILFVNMFQQLLSYLPIQILGGLGIAEAGSVYFYSFFGHDPAVFIPLILGSRILFYLMNGIIFLYLLFTGSWARSAVMEDKDS